MRSRPQPDRVGTVTAAKAAFTAIAVRSIRFLVPPALLIGTGLAARGDDRPPGTERPGAAEAAEDDRVPSGSPLADARAEFRRRHGRVTTRVPTAFAAVAAAESLLQETAGEPEPAMRWVLLDEARKLGVAAGNAAIVGRAIRLASAEFDFDELLLEIRSLREIPLRALPRDRAAELAAAAEALATRAESDGRDRLAIDALALAVRGWQAAGDDATARLAAARHDRKVAPVNDQLRAAKRPGHEGDAAPFRGGRKGPG